MDPNERTISADKGTTEVLFVTHSNVFSEDLSLSVGDQSVNSIVAFLSTSD